MKLFSMILPLAAVVAVAAPVSQCHGPLDLTADQRANLQLELALAKQLGADAVAIWCDLSGIVYVIADAETGAKPNPSGAVSFLKNNAAAAAAACPMISRINAVKAVTAIPANAVLSPITGG